MKSHDKNKKLKEQVFSLERTAKKEKEGNIEKVTLGYRDYIKTPLAIEKHKGFTRVIIDIRNKGDIDLALNGCLGFMREIERFEDMIKVLSFGKSEIDSIDLKLKIMNHDSTRVFEGLKEITNQWNLYYLDYFEDYYE
mgnify:CR=1 FL=1